MLRDMEQATSSSVRQIYQQKVLTASEDISQHATSVPRDMEQVLNCLKNVRTWQRLSRDALYNLHEIAYDTEFIHHITTFPDLLVIMYNPTVLRIFTEVIHSQDTQVLSYDTTFTLGDFYLSVLIFHQTDFCYATPANL